MNNFGSCSQDSSCFEQLWDVEDMNDSESWSQCSKCYEKLRIIDGMNDYGSWGQGSRCCEQLRTMVEMNDFGSWAMSFGCYEKVRVVNDMNNSRCEFRAFDAISNLVLSAVCCEVISQPFLCICEISQTSFAPAKWSLVLPDIYDQHFEIFFIRFLLSKSQNSPCKPPIIRFLSF